MNGSNVIGIIGTAKNTGKTTTLAALLQHASDCDMRVGVTGIGYDGEMLDTITGLPKPRLQFHRHSIVATSESCLDVTTAGFTIRGRTGIQTPLGEVLIAEITRIGWLVVAGPNTSRSLGLVLDALREYAPDLVLVDGSLNRIAPMATVGRVVFATGAARATDPALLAQEMRAIEQTFCLPRRLRGSFPVKEIIMEQGAQVTRFAGSSLYDTEDAEAIFDLLPQGGRATITISGFVAAMALEALCKRALVTKDTLVEIVLRNPIMLLLAAQSQRLMDLLSWAVDAQITVSIAGGPFFCAMTVNPFYPDLRDNAFVPAYIDRSALIGAVSNAVSVPVFNITESDPAALMDACLCELPW